MIYKLYITKNGTEYLTDCIFQDVLITRRRNADNPLLIETLIEGSVVLFDADYTRFYTNVNQILEGRLTETDHQNLTVSYQVLISFDDNYNPTTKFIKANLSENNNIAILLRSISNNFVITTTFNLNPKLLCYGDYITGFTYPITNIIGSLLINILPISLFFDVDAFLSFLSISNKSIEKDYYLFEKYSLKENISTLTDEESEILGNNEFDFTLNINLELIFNTLQNIFSIYWNITDADVYEFKRYVQNYLQFTNFDEYSNVQNEIIFVEKKPQYTQFITPHTKQLFKTSKVKYSYSSKQNDTIEYPFGTEFQILPRDKRNTQDLNLFDTVDNQIDVNNGYPGDFMYPEYRYNDANFKYISVVSHTNNYIKFLNVTTPVVAPFNYYYTRGFYLFAGQRLRITFKHRFINATCLLSKNIKNRTWNVGLGFINSNGTPNYQNYDRTVFVAQSGFYYFVLLNVDIASVNNEIKDFECLLDVRQIRYQDSTSDYGTIYGHNGRVSIDYALNNFRSEMPFTAGIDDNGSKGFTKKNDETRILNTVLPDKLSQIDFTKGIVINGVTYRLDEVKRGIVEKTKKFDLIKITKKS